MKNKNIISPVGLKGNEINERMKQLMGISSINENKSNIVVELTKMGPDGKAYAIIRENHDYYIKSTNKTSGLVAEDFQYIGGLQNKKQEAYPSYAKAIKHLNLRFNSLSEAYNADLEINTFLDDNLLSEDVAGFSQYQGNGFSNQGNMEGNSSLYEEEETSEDTEIQGLSEEEAKNNPWAICTASVGRDDKEKFESCVTDVKKQKGIKENATEEDYGTNMVTGEPLPKPDPIVEDGDLTKEEQAVEDMLNESWMDEELTGNQGRIDMNHNDAIDAQDFDIMRGMDEEDEFGKPTLNTATNFDEWITALDDASAKEILHSIYSELGAPVVNIAKRAIGAIGGPEVRDALNRRDGLQEGKLSIERAIDQMDSLIDGLSDSKKKVKTQK